MDGTTGFRIGERIGEYEVIGHLGRGGMGSVYKVRNTISERVEALKVLLPDMAATPALADRFLREIKILASLEHPNIATLRTALQQGNRLLMVMEFAEGVTLEQLFGARLVQLHEAIGYIGQVLEALDFAHSQGVVHRDIKPANIMVNPNGRVKLLDFGIASTAGGMHLTASGAVLGSAYYMSPEQVRSLPLDGRSDLYSLGVTLYEITTGRKPFQADSAFALMCAHIEQRPVPAIHLKPDMPPLLNEIIARALEKDPAHRFQSAGEFRRALQALGGSVMTSVMRAVQAPAVSTPPPQPAAAPPPPPPQTSTMTAPVSALDPAALEKLRKDLAAYIGPMARVLVSRAAKTAPSLDQLYVALASEIHSEKDRQAFLAQRPK